MRPPRSPVANLWVAGEARVRDKHANGEMAAIYFSTCRGRRRRLTTVGNPLPSLAVRTVVEHELGGTPRLAIDAVGNLESSGREHTRL